MALCAATVGTTTGANTSRQSPQEHLAAAAEGPIDPDARVLRRRQYRDLVDERRPELREWILRGVDVVDSATEDDVRASEDAEHAEVRNVVIGIRRQRLPVGRPRLHADRDSVVRPRE